jgi:hypothetical protein
VVKAVNANGPHWCKYEQPVADIQVVLSTRHFWQIRNIQRLANYEAHGLAKATVKQIMNRVCIMKISESISNIIILEHSTIGL